MKIGFIGLGHMGFPMARNLLDAGHEIVLYNRTRGSAEPLGWRGARIAASPAEAAAAAEVLVTMLSDDGAVRDAVLGGGRQEAAISALPAGAVHMCSSTISVEMARELAAAHARRGQGYISAPVLGRPEAAEQKKLWVVAAGPREHVERCRPVIEAVGRGSTVLGEEAWKANLVKIGVNFVLASVIETFAEAFALMEKTGTDPKLFLEVANGGAFQSPVIENYGTRMAERRYEPAGFRMRLGLKDVALALTAAGEATVPMPLASLLHDRYLSAIANGDGNLDWSAVTEVARRDAGLHTDHARLTNPTD